MVVSSKSNYEAIRKQRVEENKKRLEELNLKKLSDSLLTPTPKRSPVKHGKPRVNRVPAELVPVRRSSRFTDKPPVSYKEMPPEPMERPRRSYSYQRRDLLNRIYASDEVRAYAIERAEQLQSGLESDVPSFIKPMLQSHVTGGFWLGLPVPFCKNRLPSHDALITLEDENGEESETKYLVHKTGLSGGWRGFAIDHQLVDGDALVFQLLSPIKFKVFIIRAYESNSQDRENDQEENEENENDKEKQENENGKEDQENENGKEEQENEKEDGVDDHKDLNATHLVRRSKRIRAGSSH